MAKTLTIPWADGNGNIILTYTGQGDGVVTVQSDTDNLGDDRSQTITLRTTGSKPVTAQVTVTQPTGMLPLPSRVFFLRASRGLPLRVPPQT